MRSTFHTNTVLQKPVFKAQVFASTLRAKQTKYGFRLLKMFLNFFGFSAFLCNWIIALASTGETFS